MAFFLVLNLQNPETRKIRVLMRRDKILKICANHFSTFTPTQTLTSSVTPSMELRPNVGNDKSWVYHVAADFADEVAKPEMLAVRFNSVESMCGPNRFLITKLDANKFKEVFEEAKIAMKEFEPAETETKA